MLSALQNLDLPSLWVRAELEGQEPESPFPKGFQRLFHLINGRTFAIKSMVPFTTNHPPTLDTPSPLSKSFPLFIEHFWKRFAEQKWKHSTTITQMIVSVETTICGWILKFCLVFPEVAPILVVLPTLPSCPSHVLTHHPGRATGALLAIRKDVRMNWIILFTEKLGSEQQTNG